MRSVLYIPGNRERAIEKARSLRADAIIIDLEDAVSPGRNIISMIFLAGRVLTPYFYGSFFLCSYKR